MGILHRLVFLLASVLLVPLATGATTPVPAEPLAVGSKRFTESYVLGEILRLTLEQGGVPALHRQGLGNTAIVEQALRSGRIDLYPEYTGTICLLYTSPSPRDS